MAVSFNLEDIHPDLGTGPHPAFVVNGVVKNELFIATYPAIIEKGCAISIPGQSPKINITFDAAKAACVANGPGYHLLSAWERAAIALWCLKNGFQPRGNTASRKSHEASWETGIPARDNALKTLGGSGPASWRHDGTLGGIADLVGNVLEWNDGMKLVDGRFYFPVDNNFNQAESAWPASAIYLDATTGPHDRSSAGLNGAPVISDRITKYTETPTPPGGGDTGEFVYTGILSWASVAVAATFDSLEESIRQKAAQLLITPKLTSSGSALFSGIKGSSNVRNYGTRLPVRGGTRNSGGSAGLACLFLHFNRSLVDTYTGFRPAFIL